MSMLGVSMRSVSSKLKRLSKLAQTTHCQVDSLNSMSTLHIEETYAAVHELLDLNLVDYSIQNVATIEQLKELWRLDMQAYQNCTIPFKTFKQWWSHYPFGSKVYLENNAILAAIGFYPIEVTMALAFMNGELPETDLVPVRLRDCLRTPQHYWYASGILLNNTLLDADPHRRLRDHPVKPLLKNALHLWLGSGHMEFPAKLFALGLTPEGTNMLCRFGFSETRSAEAMPDHCGLYDLTLTSTEQVLKVLAGRSLHDSQRI